MLLAGCAGAPQTEPEPPTPAAEPEPAPPMSEVRVTPQRAFPEDSLYNLLVAEFALRRRQYNLALDSYMREAEYLRDPGVSAHTTRLAQFMQDEPAAVTSGRLWVELEPDDLEARITLANLLARRGEVIEALDNMEVIVRAGGNPNFTALANGFDTLDHGQHMQLQTRLNALSAEFPKDNQLIICRALLLETMGRTREALAALEPVFDTDPGQLQAIVLEVKLRQDLGQTDDLYSRIEGVLEQEPENSRLRMQYARLLTRNDLGEAQRQFEILLSESPSNPDLLFSMALIHRENGELDQAREMLLRLLVLRQREDEAYYYLGKTAEEQDQQQQAVDYYAQVRPSRDFLNASDRVIALLLEANRDEALEQHFDALRQRYPTHNEQLYVLESEGLVEYQRLEPALDRLNEGLDAFPESTSLQYSRSMVYEKLDDLALMEQDLRAIIAREPNNATALNALGYTLANRTQRFAEAEQLIAQALQLEPDEPAILDSMGWIKYRLGDYEEALDYLRRAYEQFPDPEVAAHLGEVLWALGESGTALEVWRAALAQNPEHPVLNETMQRLGATPTES